jgi:hypothetical protein
MHGSWRLSWLAACISSVARLVGYVSERKMCLTKLAEETKTHFIHSTPFYRESGGFINNKTDGIQRASVLFLRYPFSILLNCLKHIFKFVAVQYIFCQLRGHVFLHFSYRFRIFICFLPSSFLQFTYLSCIQTIVMHFLPPPHIFAFLHVGKYRPMCSVIVVKVWKYEWVL